MSTRPEYRPVDLQVSFQWQQCTVSQRVKVVLLRLVAMAAKRCLKLFVFNCAPDDNYCMLCVRSNGLLHHLCVFLAQHIYANKLSKPDNNRNLDDSVWSVCMCCTFLQLHFITLNLKWKNAVALQILYKQCHARPLSFFCRKTESKFTVLSITWL